MNEGKQKLKKFDKDDKLLIINDSKKHSGYKLTYLNKPPLPMQPRQDLSVMSLNPSWWLGSKLESVDMDRIRALVNNYV